MNILFLLALFLAAADAAPDCENGWIPYKDELCIKAFTELHTYEDAKEFCASQSDPTSQVSLVMIIDAEMQELLGNYTADVVDYIWLGGRFDIESSEFKWENGNSLTYSNWMDGYPRNDTDEDTCVEMRPTEVKNSVNIRGKWAHESCRRRNLAMCQKSLYWSLQDAVREIVSLRQELATLNSKVVPVGSIYVEYANQPSPTSLWPSLAWQDVTSSYEGLFFRAEGGESASWGTTQNDCAPRIKTMQYYAAEEDQFTNPIDIPASGWSEVGRAGTYYRGNPPMYDEGLSFYSEECEVRPKNQAVRMWKRT